MDNLDNLNNEIGSSFFTKHTVLGYYWKDENIAIEKRKELSLYKGFPKENNETLYWINYDYSELDNFYYFPYIEEMENILGEPYEFEISILNLN
jgi:hypothetical protein